MNVSPGQRWSSQYPDLGTGPLSLEPCVSPQYFEMEREWLFSKVWLNIGRIEQVPRKGDYFVKDIAIARASVLVVRGADDIVRAFHNVCSHRGNHVVWDEKGSCPGAFSCKYHGWKYSIQGELLFVPDEERFHGLDRRANGLTPIHLDCWDGFIFINFAAEPFETLAAFMGEMGARIRGYPFGALTTVFSYRAEVAANWKVIADAFQEPYHASFIHRRTLANTAPADNPLLHLPWIKLDRYHRSQTAPGNPAFVPTPSQALALKFSPPMDKIAPDGSGGFPPYLNPGKVVHWGGDVHTVFPNFWLDALLGVVVTYHFWPLAVDRTLWEFKLYYPQAENAAQQFSCEYAKVLFRDVLLEDLANVERVQAGIASGAKTHMFLQDNEIAVRHSYHVVDDFIAARRRERGLQ